MRGDPGRLRQVLTNLIGNAIKFTELGEVRVEVAAARNETLTTVRFDIIDSGIGISEAGRERLFQTFSQPDGSTTRKYGGTGLGLVIARQIVEQMGGAIGVESTEGFGSHFWFTVNLQECAIATNDSSSGDLRGLSVLVIDANATSRSVLQRQFESWGATQECAPSAADGRRRILDAALRGQPFDVLLLEQRMPDVDGLTLWRSIRDEDFCSSLRAILLSSAGAALTADDLRIDRLEACLMKPVRRSRLFEALHRLSTTRDARRQDHRRPARRDPSQRQGLQ